jgi:membrane protease YdiL (CAAX protease family)
VSTTDQPSTARRFHPSVTVLFTVLLVAAGALFLWIASHEEAWLEGLEQPMALAAQYFDHELDMADVPPETAGWARTLKQLVTLPASDIQDEAIRSFASLLDAHEAGVVEATAAQALLVEGRLVLVLAEARKHSYFQMRLDTLSERGPEAERLAAVVRFAYGLSDERPSEGEWEAALALLRDPERPAHTWATDRLASRVLPRLGREADGRAAEARIVERGTRTQARALGLSGIYIALGLAGLAFGATRLLSREPLPKLSSGSGSAPWSTAEGYAMVVRSGVFGLLAYIAYSMFVLFLPQPVSRSLPLGTLIGSLPMLYYLAWRVPAVHGIRLVELFGFRLEAPATALLIVSLVLIGLEQLLTTATGMLAGSLGEWHWYEGVQAELLRGGPGEVIRLFVETVIWAPLLEEIACRGLIYTTLRTRLGPWSSAVGSAALFTLPHGYSPVVALGLFTGAIASALIYERSRSLLPCIIAHALNNALVFAGSLLVYRGH